MKIKLDENLPTVLISELSEQGHEILSVYQQGLKGTADSILWEKVQAEQRFFITQDLDFSDINKFRPGTHSGILLIRLREPGRMRLRQRVKELFANKSPEDNWFGAFIVLSDHKLRIQKPEE
jgi:predicted nuclease of predicted toxin-antitoxin system